MKKSKQEIIDMLIEKGYDRDDSDGYKYLIKMPMDSVSEENVTKLLDEKLLNETLITTISEKQIKTIWLEELNELSNVYGRSKT